MAKIEHYKTVIVNGYAPKGSASNPYTWDEYIKMVEEGTWTGGFVEGAGYILPDVTIYGSLHDSQDDSFNDSYYFSDAEGSNGSSNTGGNTGGGGTGSGGDGGNSGVYADVLKPSDFCGFKKSEPRNCFERCKEMLKKTGASLNGKEILMTYSDADGNATDHTSNTAKGLDYIDSQLEKGHAVIVVVDYKAGTSLDPSRADKAGDHFVIIVGGGRNGGYHYFDPATAYQDRGTSEDNKFDLGNGKLTDKNNCTGKGEHNYTVSSIRQNH